MLNENFAEKKNACSLKTLADNDEDYESFSFEGNVDSSAYRDRWRCI